MHTVCRKEREAKSSQMGWYKENTTLSGWQEQAETIQLYRSDLKQKSTLAKGKSSQLELRKPPIHSWLYHGFPVWTETVHSDASCASVLSTVTWHSNVSFLPTIACLVYLVRMESYFTLHTKMAVIQVHNCNFWHLHTVADPISPCGKIESVCISADGKMEEEKLLSPVPIA